jgi:hypothetical protein
MKKLDRINAFMAVGESGADIGLSPATNLFRKGSFSGENFDTVSYGNGTMKTMSKQKSFKVQTQKLIRSTSECLLKIFYESKYMDPELFIAALKTVREFTESPECK